MKRNSPSLMQHLSPRHGQKGRNSQALILVLALMVLISALMVGFLLSASSGRMSASNYSTTARTRQLADLAVNMVQGPDQPGHLLQRHQQICLGFPAGRPACLQQQRHARFRIPALFRAGDDFDRWWYDGRVDYGQRQNVIWNKRHAANHLGFVPRGLG